MDSNEKTLRSLYAKRDKMAAALKDLDRQIMTEAREWAQERKFYGLGPDRVQAMILRPF